MRNAILEAEQRGDLLASSVQQLNKWLDAAFLPDWALASLQELVDQGAWTELNDRFYRGLAFGTGGMRGRTVGKVATAIERGDDPEARRPAHAAVGAAYLNDFNLVRATMGLFAYARRHLNATGRKDVAPVLVIAHDVRHFSRHFCELAASVWTRLGGRALIFDGPRSTPHLSFAVRRLRATCGVVITASHNPPHDNGYKVYFEDGAQVVAPHAEGIITEVQRVAWSEVGNHLAIDLERVGTVGPDLDAAYLREVVANVLDPEVIRRVRPKIVFTPIHGTGAVTSVPALESLGVEVVTVPSQMEMDGRFPTVKSPNPENAEALTLGMATAEESGALAVIATDPDADRMGVAVRDDAGHLHLLTGNQIGSLLAESRIRALKASGVLPSNGSPRATLIKTFVTTPLQDAIGRSHGLKVINTLTGFKWIGAKLRRYEQELHSARASAGESPRDYDALPLAERRSLLLAHSTFYVFGGEESYGYLASDQVRDKDANAAVVLFAELIASLHDAGKSVPAFLDELYVQYGYHQEHLVNIVYEGAEGARRIRRILDSYRQDPPRQLGEFTVSGADDFGQDDIEDADGEIVPKEDFFFLELENGYRFAVRGSGTEPKIKFYLFAREDVAEPVALDAAKARADKTIKALAAAIETDARTRADS